MNRFLALATDYDGTLAFNGEVAPTTVEAIQAARVSGRRTILVTGRRLDDLEAAFDRLDLFDRVVLENGAVLYRPDNGEVRLLAPRCPPALVQALESRGAPVASGFSIVATWAPHESDALEAVRELGLEYQIIFNKGAVMLLPSGHNKATGLASALSDLGLSYHNTVGIGDAENDHSFLGRCELSVAVQNGLPGLRSEVDVVTRGDHGDGVCEVVEQLRDDDLRGWSAGVSRHDLRVGDDGEGSSASIGAYGEVVLIAGDSQSGKSTFAAGLLHLIAGDGYQACIVDPEGDYTDIHCGQAIAFRGREPLASTAVALLRQRETCLTADLLHVPAESRPKFLADLLRELTELREETGRPHWLFVDEAHHMLWEPLLPAAREAVAEPSGNLALITVHPAHVAAAVLRRVSTLVITSADPLPTVREFCRALGLGMPGGIRPLRDDEILMWRPQSAKEARPVRSPLIVGNHRRHRRKYAQGDVGAEHSFYFRGPRLDMNIPARNLSEFVRLARSLGDETWSFHLRRGDFANWFRECVRDEELATKTADLARDPHLTAAESRTAVEQSIIERYGPPA